MPESEILLYLKEASDKFEAGGVSFEEEGKKKEKRSKNIWKVTTRR
jgi:hypothetical protein